MSRCCGLIVGQNGKILSKKMNLGSYSGIKLEIMLRRDFLQVYYDFNNAILHKDTSTVEKLLATHSKLWTGLDKLMLLKSFKLYSLVSLNIDKISLSEQSRILICIEDIFYTSGDKLSMQDLIYCQRIVDQCCVHELKLLCNINFALKLKNLYAKRLVRSQKVLYKYALKVVLLHPRFIFQTYLMLYND